MADNRRGSPSPELAVVDPIDVDDFRYPGSKGQAGVHEWICDRLPAHVDYAEPFAGKAGIYRHKIPALRTWLVDQDASVVDWLNRQLARTVTGPRHTTVLRGCGIRWMRQARRWATPELLVYCDPPYLPSTRTRRKLYRHEMSLAGHESFLRAAVALPCCVVISGYPSELYSHYLAGWTMETRLAMTRGRSWRTECLWSNATAANASGVGMTYGELGTDWRDRDRVSKKLARWVAKFTELPERERRAILLGLMSCERDRASKLK